MRIGVAVVSCLLGSLDATDITPERLAVLVRDQWQELDDVEFIYEGSMYHRYRKTKVPPGAHDPFEESYQGAFAYRRDDAAHIDVYVQPSNPTAPLTHATKCLLNGSVRGQNRRPDGRLQLSRREAVSGYIGSLDEQRSPLRIFLLPHFLLLLRQDPSLYHVRVAGWERCSERMCLKVEIVYRPPGFQKDAYTHKFWLDMQRGANPLRYDYFDTDNLRMQADEIGLGRFEVGDKVFWLPVRGRRLSFLTIEPTGIRFLKTPVFEETFEVVDGSVRVNQDLPDRRFSLDWEATPASDGLRKSKERFEAQGPRRSGPRGVEDRIRRVIAEADGQAKALEASAPSRESWTWAGAARLGLLTIGSACLIVAGFRKWRE